MSHNHHLSRRGFITLGGVALGGATLACAGGSKLIELTAVPTHVSPTAQPVPTHISRATQLVPTLAAGEFADTILVNGNIVTIDAKRTTAKAIAIRNGIILLVGDDQAVRNVASDTTKVIDLKGRTVTPGLIDAHCHLSTAGLLGTAYVDINWPAVFTIKDMQAKLVEKIAKTPPGSGLSVQGG